MKNAVLEVCGKENCHAMRRQITSRIQPSLDNTFSSSRLARAFGEYFFAYVAFHAYFSPSSPPAHVEPSITRNFTARCVKRRVSQPSEVHRRLCLTFLRNSTPPVAITTARPSPTIFSQLLRADIMLTSAPPTFRYFESVSLIYELYSPSFSLSRFLVGRHLLTPTGLEAAPPGTKHPRPVKMLQTRHSRGSTGASGGYRNGTRFRSFSA